MKDVESLISYYTKVYDLLVQHCGAREVTRANFIYHHARCKEGCDEFRFCGDLGHGGKYYSRESRVTCYKEDETPERLAAIEAGNHALKKLRMNWRA